MLPDGSRTSREPFSFGQRGARPYGGSLRGWKNADVEVGVYGWRGTGWRDGIGTQSRERETEISGQGEAYERLGVKIVGVVQWEALEVKGTVELRRRICRATTPAAQRAGDNGAGSGVNGDNLSADNPSDE